MLNKPANLNILKRKTKRTSVEVGINGHVVTRIRTASQNLYMLDGKEKKAFGRGVPDEIEKIVLMDDLLHFQKQADPYFMLSSLRPTECAKALERFADLSIISLSLLRARAQIHQVKTTICTLTSGIERVKGELDSLQLFLSLKDSIILLFADYRKHIRMMRQLRALEENNSILQGIDELLESLEKKATLLREGENIKQQLARASLQDTSVYELERIRTLLQGIDALLSYSDRVQQFKDSQEEAQKVLWEEGRVETLERIRAELSQTERQQEEAEKALQETLSQIRRLPMCPKCKRPFQ